MECWATIWTQLHKQYTTWHDYLRIQLAKDMGQPPDCLYCVRQTLRSCMYVLNFENCCYRTYIFIEQKNICICRDRWGFVHLPSLLYYIPSCFYTFGMPSLSSIQRLDSCVDVYTINFRFASRWKQSVKWRVALNDCQHHTTNVSHLQNTKIKICKYALRKNAAPLILHLVIT